MTDNIKTFGELIRLFRRDANMTVDTFIEKLGDEHAVSAPYITKVEVHDELPSDEVAYKMGEVLGIAKSALKKVLITARVKRLEKSLINRYDVAISLKIEGLADAFL